MPFLTPDVYFPHITDIPGSFFKERGIRLMILDVDNTLTSHNNPTPFPGIPEWIEERKGEGLTPVILSNNTPERVAPFAELIGLPFVAGAAKPLTFGITRALKRYGMRAEETCLIGDQLFTDILCGNLCGCVTILVEPYAEEGYGLYRIKRPLEKPLLRLYHRRKRRNAE